MSFCCTTDAPIGTLESTGCQGGYEPAFSNRRCLIPDDRRVPKHSPDRARVRSETEWSPTVGDQDNFCRLPYRLQAKVVIDPSVCQAKAGDELITIGLASGSASELVRLQVQRHGVEYGREARRSSRGASNRPFSRWSAVPSQEVAEPVSFKDPVRAKGHVGCRDDEARPVRKL